MDSLIDPVLLADQHDYTIVMMDVIPTLKEVVTTSFARMWESRETAEKHLNLLGTKATDAFIKHAAAQDLIEKYDPTWTHLTPPFDLEFHVDGRVTLK